LVLRDGLPERTLLNVNVPDGEPHAAVLTIQGRREHEGSILEGLDPRRRAYYWIEEGRDRWRADALSDVNAVRAGFISVTPLQTDTTNHSALEGLKRWDAIFRASGAGDE
jgi:5'-nucleotidase